MQTQGPSTQPSDKTCWSLAVSHVLPLSMQYDEVYKSITSIVHIVNIHSYTHTPSPSLSLSPSLCLSPASQFDLRRPATISGICRGGSKDTMFSPGEHTFDLVAEVCSDQLQESDVITGEWPQPPTQRHHQAYPHLSPSLFPSHSPPISPPLSPSPSSLPPSLFLPPSLSLSAGYNSVSRFIIEEVPDQKDDCFIILPVQ